jgi:hypothetical protein
VAATARSALGSHLPASTTATFVLADRIMIKDIVVDFINLHYYPRDAPDWSASNSSGDEKSGHVTSIVSSPTNRAMLLRRRQARADPDTLM